MTKNVAVARCASRASSTCGVVVEGPSSKVSAIRRSAREPAETSRGSVTPPALRRVAVAGPRVRRSDRDQLGPLGPGLERAHRLLRHPDGVPRLQLDHLVIQLDPQASVDDDVDLFLLL